MKSLPIGVVCFVWLLVGFGLKSAFETKEIAHFVSNFGLVIVVVALAILLFVAITFVLSILVQSRRSDTRVLANFMAWFEARIGASTAPKAIANQTPLTDLAMFLANRQKGQFYLNLTVSLVSGLLGAATLFTLYQQNAPNNREITLAPVKPSISAIVPVPAPAPPEPALAPASRLATVFQDVHQIEEALTFVTFDSRIDCPVKNDVPPSNCWVRTSEDTRDVFLLPAALRRDVADFLDARSNTETGSAPDAVAQMEQGRILRVLARNRISPIGLVFQSAHAPSSDLSDARLASLVAPNSDLTNAKLKGAFLANADLSGSAVSNAYFFESHLVEANLSGVRGDRMYVSAADLTKSDFRNAQLTNLRAIGSTLTKARFDDAILHKAQMKNVTAQGAHFSHVDLSNASLVGGNYENSVFLKSILRQADLSSAKFSGANISGADFSDANIGDADFTNAWTWSDMQPIGLPSNIDFATCRFDDAVSRTVSQRPSLCDDS